MEKINQELSQDEKKGTDMPGKAKDLGFGSGTFKKVPRLINKDGSFNVVRKGIPLFRPYDFYHTLITMSWVRFGLLVFATYLVANLVFSLAYLAVGIENLAGTVGDSALEHFLDAFFFSSQTITTLGYGRISPVGVPASIIASIESMIGLLGFAMATGLLYGRFSRPQARILWSDDAIIAPYRGGKALMFRIANQRSTQLIEVEVEVNYVRLSPDGDRRAFDKLKLELNKINFMPLSWTVVHPINEESPLWGIEEAALGKLDAEFLVLIKAFDDSFSETVYSRHSYKYKEVVWDAKFNSIIVTGKGEQVHLDLHRISEIDKM